MTTPTPQRDYWRKCPRCGRVLRTRRSKLVPYLNSYLQVLPQDSKRPFIVRFLVWIKDKSTDLWHKGGEYRVRLDLWNDCLYEGRGGYVRNPLLETLHWHWEPPE